MAQPQHISLGRLGEDIVEGYLQNRGFLILHRNYSEPWGELDLVAEQGGVLHFVEVKAGSWGKKEWPNEGDEVFRPQMHFDQRKRQRMKRIIQTYLKRERVPEETRWSADLAVVLIQSSTRKARVQWLWGEVL
jgi:putative endonuclease